MMFTAIVLYNSWPCEPNYRNVR